MHDDSSSFRYSTGYVFYAKFLLDNFDFLSDFYAPTFFISRDLKFSLNHNFKQLNSIGGNLEKVKLKVRQTGVIF